MSKKQSLHELSSNDLLEDWLVRLDKSQIKLGLENVSKVYQHFIYPLGCTTIIVGGTNGKGSTVAFLERIYLAANYQVGKLSSPELFRYNEQICLNGTAVSDVQIVQAFAAITLAEKTLSKIPSLSYFEYLVLAGLWLFKQHKVDIVLLEVGLGGRLDATNIVDCDCAVITNISLDHQHFLGHTRAEIAQEKVAISRPHKPLVCGDKNPPKTLINFIKAQQTPTTFVQKPYTAKVGIKGEHQKINAQVAKTVVQKLAHIHPVMPKTIASAIANTHLLGRLEVLVHKNQTIIVDVAHNEAAVAALAHFLKTHYKQQRWSAVFSALKDKKISAIIAKMVPLVKTWHLCPLNNWRFSMDDLVHQTKLLLAEDTVFIHPSMDSAFQAANNQYLPIVVFGSFQIATHALGMLKSTA